MSGALWPIIMLIGKNGQIGWELQRTLAPLGGVVTLDIKQLDLANPDQIRERVREIKPNLIVNAAAYTAVDKAEEEPELAMAINGTAPGVLAEEAKRLGAAIVHYSTDYVFDGTKTTPYTEKDEPAPLSVYGRSKLEGERAIQHSGAAHLILRTSWVYGLRGHNFLLTILRLAREREEIKVVDDQIGSPTWSRLVAQATAQILVQRETVLAGADGIFHLTAAGQTSWCNFAKVAIAQAYSPGVLPVKIVPIPTSAYPAAARRPAWSLLSNSKLNQTFGLALPDWEDTLRMVLERFSELFLSCGLGTSRRC